MSEMLDVIDLGHISIRCDADGGNASVLNFNNSTHAIIPVQEENVYLLYFHGYYYTIVTPMIIWGKKITLEQFHDILSHPIDNYKYILKSNSPLDYGEYTFNSNYDRYNKIYHVDVKTKTMKVIPIANIDGMFYSIDGKITHKFLVDVGTYVYVAAIGCIVFTLSDKNLTFEDYTLHADELYRIDDGCDLLYVSSKNERKEFVNYMAAKYPNWI